MVSPKSNTRERWIRIAFVVVAIAGLLMFARNVDWPAALRALSQLGVRAPLIALPYAIVMCCDTFGWRNTFEVPQAFGYFALLRVRIATEAVSNSLPAGPAIGETLKAVIMQRRFDMTLTDAAANVILAKVTIAIAQAFFTVGALVFAAPILQDSSQRFIGGPGLEWLSFGLAFGFLSFAMLVLWAVVRGRLAGRLLHRTLSISSPRLRQRLERFVPAVQRADHALGVMARVPRLQTVLSLLAFIGGFVCLGLEDFVILSLLGSGVSAPEAIALEAVLAFVRIAFFFLPAALGAQEGVAYFALRAFGVAEPEVLTAAFMVAKRAKELFWIGIGYGLLSSLHVRVGDARRPEPVATP